MSVNTISIDHIMLACRHMSEMQKSGLTENMSVRTLELFTDLYAKMLKGGTATPHHVTQVSLWSVEALKIWDENPHLKPRNHLRVEHGTPRRHFARMVMKLYTDKQLNKTSLDQLVMRYWKLAVISLEEDRRLNKIARTVMYETPEERWAAANIMFPDINV